MEKVGLIDVDGHNFPNLPLMKLSAWHKRKGDEVEWYEPFKGILEEYDIVYMSKVFSDEYTKDYEFPVYAKKVVKGGTGYAIKKETGIERYDAQKDKVLPDEIEHISRLFTISRSNKRYSIWISDKRLPVWVQNRKDGYKST